MGPDWVCQLKRVDSCPVELSTSTYSDEARITPKHPPVSQTGRSGNVFPFALFQVNGF